MRRGSQRRRERKRRGLGNVFVFDEKNEIKSIFELADQRTSGLYVSMLEARMRTVKTHQVVFQVALRCLENKIRKVQEEI